MKKSNFLLLFIALLSVAIFKGYSIYKKKYDIPDVSVVGYVSMADGIGRQSVELIASLKNQFDVHYRNTRDVDYTDVPRHLHSIIKKRKRPLGKVLIFEETLSINDKDFNRIPLGIEEHRIKIAYSMFESTKIPPLFVKRLNENFDAVIVPDPYHVEVYERCGVNKPIFVLPLGLDLSSYYNCPLKQHKNTPMVYGCFASCEVRKNLQTLVKAFYKAFGNSDKVKLVIHCRRSLPKEKEELLNLIKSFNVTNIQFQEASLLNSDYLKLFQSIDCYVSLSKGEGYSIPPREAMALGIPVILSDNTAQMSLCQSGYVRSVPSNISEKAFFDALNLTSGNYFNVEIADAAKALKDVYDNYELFLSLGQKARDYSKQFDYENLKSFYSTLVKPKNVILGKENTLLKDTLITNSQALYEKYLRLQKNKL